MNDFCGESPDNLAAFVQLTEQELADMQPMPLREALTYIAKVMECEPRAHKPGMSSSQFEYISNLNWPNQKDGSAS